MSKLFPWLLLLLALSPALAQTPPAPPAPTGSQTSLDPFQEFGKRIKAASMVEPLGSSLFGDQVSLYNGGTEFSVVDVDLPGNNALKVQVARRFKIEERRGVEDRPGFGEWELDVPYLHGVYASGTGWVAGANSTSRCSTTQAPPAAGGFTAEEFWHGASLHLPGQGDMELLVNDQPSLPTITSGGPYPWITKGFIRLECTDGLAQGSPGQGQGFIAITPDGVRYRFDHMIVRETASLTKPFANNGNPLLRDRVYLMATEVKDRFGNTVNYGYTGDKLTTITSSDGRSITLVYGNDDLIDTVTVNSTPTTRTWSYGYQFSNLPPGVPESLLTSVVRPDGSTWNYEITVGGFAYTPSALKSGDPGTCLEPARPKQGVLQYKITHPAGAIGTFDFSFRRHYRVLSSQSQVICTGQESYYTLLFPNYFDVWSLSQKTLSGPAVPSPLTWGYDYGDDAGALVPCESCDPAKEVTVTEPDGAKVISRFGVLFEINEGRLLGEEVKSPANVQLRNTAHEYASAAGTYPDIYGTSLITGFDPVANRIRPLTGTTITQQGKTFDVDHSNFDVFGRARDHTRSSNLSGNPSKTERATFHDDYAIWVLGQPEKTVLLGSPDVEMSETTYDATWALPQTQEVYGRLDRSFEWHLSQGPTQQKGRLWKLKDAQDRAYVLDSYYRGVPQSIVLPTSASHTMAATVDYFGNLTFVTDAVGFQTGYLYDSMDRLQQINWPTGDTPAWLPTTIVYAKTESSEHGVPAQLWKRTETTGTLIKETWFDAFWRPILDRESASDASTTATFWRRGFDHRNRQTFAAYPLSSLTGGNYLNATAGAATAFDALDRTISIVAAAEAPHNTVTTSFFYDPNFITRIRDARGYETSTSFLAWDSPSTELPTAITAPEGQTTTILRDIFGKPRKLTRSGTWNGSPIAVDRDYVYDAHQRLCKTIEPESKATVVDYDTVNQIAWTAIGQNLSSLTDCERGSVPPAQKSMHAYDAMNRLTSIDHPSGTEDLAYTYFADGALQTASTFSQLTFPPAPPATPITTWTYAYNKRRLLELETLSYNSRSFELDWSYNNRGQILSLGYPDDESVDWNPDARGRPRRAWGIAGNYATVNSRHPNGAVANLSYGNSQVLSTTQNTRQLPSTRVVGSLMDYTLTYDKNANLTGIVDAIPVEEQVEPPPAPPEIKFLDTRSMVYDGLNRMTQANADDVFGNETYVYDPLDNVRSANFELLGTFTHVYDPARHRLDAIHFNGDAFLDYTHNDQGDTTLRQFAPTGVGDAVFANGFEPDPAVNRALQWARNVMLTQSLSYDRAHRLTAVAGLEGYVYDAHGHRVAIVRAGDGNRRYQIYSRDGRFLYSEFEGEIVDYVHVDGELVAERRPPVGGVPLIVRYVHADMRGSPVVYSNSAGSLIRRTVYEPYGTTHDGQYIDGPGFTGHVTDMSTGLSYMQQRYYDPIAFRFLSPDPVPSSSNSFNVYWYANNNPMTFLDPDGRYTCKGGKDACAEFDKAVTGIRKAAGNLPEGSPEQTRLNKISDFFGKPGDKNGVKVTITSGGKDESLASARRGLFGTIQISFSPGLLSNMMKSLGPDANRDSELAGIVAHEGDHGLTQAARGNSRTRAEVLKSERSAYRSQGQVHRGLGYGTSPYRLWTPSGGIDENRVEDMSNKSADDWDSQ